MKALVVYSHPNPKSFNKAILDAVREDLERRGAEVRVHDLYAQRFDPVLAGPDFEALSKGTVREDVAREQADLAWADLVVFIYPIWWYERPAILKGWFDRVFSLGFAYRATPAGLEGLLKGKRGLVLTTSGADEKTDRATGMTQAKQVTMMRGTLGAAGIAPMVYRNYFAVPMVTPEERHKMLEDVRARVAEVLA